MKYNLMIFNLNFRDSNRRRGDGREMLPSRSRLGLTGLGSSQDLGSSNGDLYYNSRSEGHWSYQPPPPPVITHQPKPSTTQHFQPYERGYPKTLESLAEKVCFLYHSNIFIKFKINNNFFFYFFIRNFNEILYK